MWCLLERSGVPRISVGSAIARHVQSFRQLCCSQVATCIGEEGLDIPDVDLIVCLDVSSSPTRSVQRMGRTGRHRAGRVVYILSEGAEQDKYKRGQQVRF